MAATAAAAAGTWDAGSGGGHTAGTYQSSNAGYTSSSKGTRKASDGGGWFGGGSRGDREVTYGHGHNRSPVPQVDFPAYQREIIAATFQRWDTRNIGFLVQSELSNVLTALGISKTQFKQIFVQADWNSDSRISFDEFCYWLKHLAPTEVKEKALSPVYKVVAQKLSVIINGDSRCTPFVRWRDQFINHIICESPTGPSGHDTEIPLNGAKCPMVFEIPSDDKRSVLVEVCTRGMLGASVIGIAELALGTVAHEMALGLGQKVREIKIDLLRPESKTPSKVGEVVMNVAEVGEGDAMWAKQIVAEWKSNGLPELPSFVEVNAVLETLVIEPDDKLEGLLTTRTQELTQQALKDFSSWTPEKMAEELADLTEWMYKFKGTAAMMKVFTLTQFLGKLRTDIVTLTIQDALKKSEPDFRVLKQVLKFAYSVDNCNPHIGQLEKVFKDLLKLRDDARIDDVMGAPDADLVQLQPGDFGITLLQDFPEPPRVDGHVRFDVRDKTAKRVLEMIGCYESLHYTLGQTYERMAPETISDPDYRMSSTVASVAKSIVMFRGEKAAKSMTLPEMMDLREHLENRKADSQTLGKTYQAMLGRFDVVAQPVIAEYDKNFEPLSPSDLPNGFFGSKPDPTIGGKGWFYVLHAAAMNIGESTRTAEDSMNILCRSMLATRASGQTPEHLMRRNT
jgi:hypothetical protein